MAHAYLLSGAAPQPAQMCGKMAFRSLKEARRRLGNVKKNTPRPTAFGLSGVLQAYKCRFCSHYHLGHS